MRRSRILLVAALGLAAASTLAPASEPRTVHRFHPGPARQQLDFAVPPGGRLRIDADLCTRALRDDEQLLVFVPGLTMGFVPVADLVDRDLVVPRDLRFPGEPRIWLDRGPFDRGPLAVARQETTRPSPCGDVERYVDIAVAAAPASDLAPGGTLTLVFPRYDANLLPLNPAWAGGGRPSICAACDGFRVERRGDGSSFVPAVDSDRCTLQRPSIDAGCRPRQNLCPAEPGRSLSGHVNWGPATFTGRLWTGGAGVHITRDSDVSLYFEPEGGSGAIAAPPGARYDGRIGVEFASSETVRWFRTPWWKQVPFRKRSYEPVASLFGILERHPGVVGPPPALDGRPATIIGLFGIDTVDDPHSELHPVYALAVQTEDAPDREVWQVFARTWGTEGYCGGRLDHRTDLQRAALVLEGAAPGAWRSASGRFFDHGLPFEGWKVHGGPGPPTLVLELPQRSCSVVEGELVLRRSQDGGKTVESGPAPVGEPVRWNPSPGKDQLCVEGPWFVPVP